MKNIGILPLLMLSLSGAPESRANSLDSLRQAVAIAAGPADQMEAMLELMIYYRMRGHDSTLVLGETVLGLAKENHDADAQVRALIQLGSWHHNKGRLGEAKQFYFRGMVLARENNLKRQMGPLSQNLALSYRRGFQQDSAFYYFAAAEKAFLAENNTAELWRPYWGMAQIYQEKGDFEKADEYGWKALKITEKLENRTDYGFMLFNLFALYFQNDRFDKMAEIRAKREKYQMGRKNSREIMEIPEHTSFLFFFSEDTEALENHLIRAIQHYDSSGNLFSKAYCYEDLGDLYLAGQKPDKARESYLRASTIFERTGDAFRRGRNLYQLYLTARRQGDFPGSLTYLEAYKILADSLGNAEMNASLKLLQVRYETEKKEQALRINQLELAQKTLERNLLLGSSVLLALLAAGIFMGFRQRLAAHKMIADQNHQLQRQRILQLEQEKKLLALDGMIEGQETERIRIAKDLHDGLGGLLTSIKTHFGGLNDQLKSGAESPLYQKTHQMIEGACLEVRRISHNMAPGALMLSGLPGAVEDLAEQIRENGLECHLEWIGLEASDLDQTRSVMVFRILQELVNNILKHANAGEVLIQILAHQDEMIMVVEDNGRGFVPETAAQKKSLGLKNIDARVRFLKGEWQIDSVPGEGTTVNIRFPR